MAGGLAALLDDIAALAKLAAASIDDVSAAAGRASAKAAGVVIDDTAVTPRYVQGFAAARELPMIRRIAVGSLRNKLAFILPAALLLSQFLPWALTPLLMVGGTYLAFEGAEKVVELLRRRRTPATVEVAVSTDPGPATTDGAAPGEHGTADRVHPAEHPDAEGPAATEDAMVRGAIRTDFILSAEIMVIALNEVADEPLASRAVILAVVALGITALVYGVVALIVKMDDIGLRLAQTRNGAVAAFGRGLVRAMPRVLAVLSTVGIVAMLWVGGHILLVGAAELGWTTPEHLVHLASEAVAAVRGVGGLLAWLVGTAGAALAGLVVGSAVVGVVHLLPGRRAAH